MCHYTSEALQHILMVEKSGHDMQKSLLQLSALKCFTSDGGLKVDLMEMGERNLQVQPVK